MTDSRSTGPNDGNPEDQQTRETLALIAHHILKGTVPTMPEPEHSTGSQS